MAANSIIFHSLIVGIAKSIGILALFIFNIVAARKLSVSAFGEYNFITSIFEVLVMVSEFGLATLLVREVPKEEDFQLKRKLLKNCLSLSFIFDLILGLVVIIYSVSVNNYEYIYIGVFLLIVKSSLRVIYGYFHGLGKPEISQYGEITRYFFLIALLSILPDMNSAKNIILADVFFMGLLLTVLFYSVLVKNEPSKKIEISHNDYFTLAKISLPLFMISVLYYLNNTIDVIIIGLMLGDEEVAFFSVAMKLAVTIIFPMTIMNMVIGPRISKFFTEKKYHDVTRIKRYVFWALLTISLPLGACLIIYGDLLIHLIYTDAYINSYPILLIIVFGQIISSIYGQYSVILVMIGKSYMVVRAMLVSIAVNMILNIILIQLYGVEGVAYATTASMFVWNFILYYKGEKVLAGLGARETHV